jgi:hypothetical protein
MKECTTCQETKDLINFYKNISTKDGLSGQCKVCHYKSVNKDKEKRKNRIKKYYLKNKDWLYKKSYLKLKTEDFGLRAVYYRIVTRCNGTAGIKSKILYRKRGIKNEWKNYQEFKKDMYDSYVKHIQKHGKKQTTIDRLDPYKNYCKENCRWATYQEQNSHLGYALK